MRCIKILERHILTLILLSFSTTIYAQGSLMGKVIDAETGEELIGATVMMEGTSIGVATDLDGNYVINNIEPGVYTFVCQYISYETQIFKGVKITEREVAILNVQLPTASVGLEEVVIQAKLEQRTEAALLTVQKKSANVVDGISAQQISRAGASVAAGALRRVTGVNVENGKYIYVRGLSDRYSKTTLNGADIPGLDPNRNTVQMDIFPANLIDNIIVYKTFSPDKPADYTGGLVNIVTKDFPEQFTLHFGIRLGYNTQASFNNNFLTYQGSPTDFLGYDNGFRSLPSAAAKGIPVYPSQRSKLTSITEDFNKIMAPETVPSVMNGSMQFSIGNQFNIGKRQKQLGFVFGLSYKYADQYYDNGIKGRWKLAGAGEENLEKEHYYNDVQGSKNYLWGAIGNLTYKINNANKISLNIIKNQNGISSARYLYGQKPSDNIDDLVIQTRKLQWVQRSLGSGQLRGEHYFEDLSRLRIEWLGAVTLSDQDEPDLRFFTNSYYPDLNAPNNYQIEPSIYKVPSRFYRYMNEKNYFGKADFTLEIGQKTKAPKLKFGGLFTYKNRDFEETRVNYNFQFAPNVYNGSVPEFIADSMIGTNYQYFEANTGANFGVYIQGVPDDDLKNSYLADQTIGAGYLMVDAFVFKKIRVIAGLRYEYTNINSSSKDTSLPTGSLKNNDLLPAVALTYQLKESMNLRFNYSRTLARPTFRELAPYASEDFSGGEVWVGNSDLKQTLIDNIDVRWEYFFNPGQVISLGAFYKKFKDPIEVVDNPSAQNPELTWQNVDHATLYGLELDFRKSLDFVHALRHFKIGTNITYIYSQVKIDSLELDDLHQADPDAPDTRPMFGQSPYIINAYLVYNNPDLGLDVNLTYNVSGPKILINVKGITPDVYGQPFNLLNLTAGKSIGENFYINFRWKNLLNDTYQETYTYNNKEYQYREFKLGTVIEIGFQYKIH